MPGVVELIDRAVDLPPGPQLFAMLAELPWSRVPNARLVEVLQAHSRLLAHVQAGLLAGMVEIVRAVPVADLPADDPLAVVRAGEDFEWASHEIAAGLTWTPTSADRELGFALTLARGLPQVFAALERGLIDRGKAKVFADHLDPARGELTAAQIRRLCERFVPLAPGWTARQLSRRLLAAIQAIDPEYHKRRYRRGLRERGVVLHLDRDGTATLSGEGLPPDEAAAAAARLDRLAEAAKRAGHPGRLGQICADLYLGMLDGFFHGLTEDEILARLLAHPRPEDTDGTQDTEAEAPTAPTASVTPLTGSAAVTLPAPARPAPALPMRPVPSRPARAWSPLAETPTTRLAPTRGRPGRGRLASARTAGAASGSGSGRVLSCGSGWPPCWAAISGPGRSPVSARSTPSSPAPPSPASVGVRNGSSPSSTPPDTCCWPGRYVADPATAVIRPRPGRRVGCAVAWWSYT